MVATTFRNFPSYPQIYLDPLAEQPDGPETPEIVPLRRVSQPRLYTQQDVCRARVHRGSAAPPDRGKASAAGVA